LQVLALEARIEPAEIRGRELVEVLQLARQEAAAKRRVGDETDTQLADGLEVSLTT
jgi:hypothetical protein